MDDISHILLSSYYNTFANNNSKITSFDRLMCKDLPNIIKASSPIIVKYNHGYDIIEIEAVTMNKPVVTEKDGTSHELNSKEARLRNLDYDCQVYGHMRYRYYQMPDNTPYPYSVVVEKGTLLHDEFVPYVKMHQIAIFVLSLLCHQRDGMIDYGECPSDIGGYAITKGAEKILMYRERLAYNKIFVCPSKNASISHIAEYRSEQYDQWLSTQNVVIELSKTSKTELPSLYIHNIPWVTFMRALGFTSAKDIYTLFRFVARERWSDYKTIFQNTLKNHQGILTRRAALARIGSISASAEIKEELKSLIAQAQAQTQLSSTIPTSSTTSKSMRSSSSSSTSTLTSESKSKSTSKSTPITSLGSTTESKHLSEKSIDSLEEIGLGFIHNKFFPNMGHREAENIKKAFMLCEMACQLIDHSKNSSLKTNKDSYFNKRTEACEDLLGPMIRQWLNTTINTSIKLNILKRRKEGKSINLHDIFSDDKVGKGVKEAIATGVWHVNKNKITQTGVSQKFERSNYICTQAQHNKVINQLQKEIKQIAPRLLNSTSYGVVCPTDSPEGATCGLIKHFSIMHHVSIGTDGAAITHLLYNKMRVVSLDKLTMKNMYDAVKQNAQFIIVYVNGVPIGVHDDPLSVAQFVKECRKKLSISPDTSTTFDHRKVDIRSDRGRNMRPLLVAENLHRLNPNNKVDGLYLEDMEWNTLLSEGIIEYVDVEEEQNLMIATNLEDYLSVNGELLNKSDDNNNENVKPINPFQFYDHETLEPIYYTHMEIHPSVFWGYNASLIPFAEHNQSPRNVYASAMLKQAMGTATTVAKRHQMYPNSMELWYAQRPIVETQIYNIMKCQNFPSGQNILLAIIASGSNQQEDACESNKAAVHFGMLCASICRTIPVTENKQGKSEYSEEFKKIDPNLTLGRKRGDHSNIESDGLIAIGSKTRNSTILAQKVSKIKDSSMLTGLLNKKKNSNGNNNGNSSSSGNNNNKIEYRCASVPSLNNESGIVDRVTITSTACGIKTAKIRMVKYAPPLIGDKFSSRHGQKGVMGDSKSPADMIMTEDGVIPHFVTNLLAFSSRMTWAQWLETMFATVCILNGKFGDATPFSKKYRDSLYNTLEEREVNLKEGHIVDEICDALRYLGMDPECEHVMYNGINGEKLQEGILMGLAYYQKLKHMVKDKIRARARGKVQALTKQPTKGRSTGGGVRFGEMEKDCLCAHGAAFNVQDRMCISSDPNYIHVCENCNNSVVFVEESEKVWCMVCGEFDTGVVVLLPYSFKLFQQEAISAIMNIKLDVERI